MTYYQDSFWVSRLEAELPHFAPSIKQRVLQTLLDENCTITLFTLPKYLYAILKTEFLLFGEVWDDTIDDIKVLFNMYEFKSNTFTRLRAIYLFYKKIFKYTKIDFVAMANLFNTEEKILKGAEAEKKNRDPRVAFNSVRRLPWKLTYEEEPEFFFKYIIQHLSVFYNFFKTTLLAATLMFIYFLYTIFFFKIQFLKQLSV